MLPHPVLATEDDEEFIIRTVLGLPEILDDFFDCLEAVYIEAKGNECSHRASILYLTIQRQLQILSAVPASSFRVADATGAHTGTEEELPKLLRRLARLFLEDVIGIGPQALSWKKPCRQIANECAEHMRHTRLRFPFWTRFRRKLITFNSPTFIMYLILYSLATLFSATCNIVIPIVRPRRGVGVPISCVAAGLLLFFAFTVQAHFILASHSLLILYSRLFEGNLIFGYSPSDPENVKRETTSHMLSSSRQHSSWDTAHGEGAVSQGTAVKVERGKQTKKGYYTIPYSGDLGYIDGRQLDAQVVMVAYDKNFLITRWNNAAEVLTGFLEDGCVGKPLSELITSASGGDICAEVRRPTRNAPIKIKIRLLAMAPVTLYTVVTPIVNLEGAQVGSLLICANAKDDIRDHRSYIHNYQASETLQGLSLLAERRSLTHEDAMIVNALHQFAANTFAVNVEELAREMVSDWEWTNVEQLLVRAFGSSIGSLKVHVDALFPPTLCVNQLVPKTMATIVSLGGGTCEVNLQMLNLTRNVFSISVTITLGDRCRPWNVVELEESVRPLLRSTGSNAYFLDDRIIIHFPCQVAAILDDMDSDENKDSSSQQAQLIAQARAIVNCTVNVVTCISNLVDQHNLSLILLKTMFVSLASVQDRADLESRLSARPCEVDVVICDSEWLSASRDLLLSGGHGVIVVPLIDAKSPVSAEFKHAVRMPIVGRDVQQMMIEVGKQVSMKKDAATALKERERILTLRQDSPWTKGRLLGRGSYGAVYEATSDLTGGKMAVKMFYFGGDGEDAINQLLNEIQIMCSLNHPNIVHYFHCERTDNNVYLFMELCDASLTDIIVGRRKKPFHLKVVQILRQVLTPIAYLHSRGITHRDIKPQNILLKGDTIKITDFGTARQGDATKEVKGTFRYMAPEVYKGEPHSLPCDIWSIGCLACELFACPPRFMEQSSLLGDMTSAEPYLEDAPSNPLLRDFIDKCFKLEPGERSTSHDLLMHPLLSANTMSAEVDQLPTVFDVQRAKSYDPTGNSAFSISST